MNARIRRRVGDCGERERGGVDTRGAGVES